MSDETNVTKWYVYCERTSDRRRVIVAGPYPTREACDAVHHRVVQLAMDTYRDGHWLWFEHWGCCESPMGTLMTKLGRVE